MYPLLIVLIPILAGLFSYPLGIRLPKVRDWFVFVVTAISFALIIGLYSLLDPAGVVVYTFPNILPPFGLSFRIDWLSVVLASITGFIWTLVSFYSLDYMKHLENLNRYYAFTLVTLGATLGTLFAGDLLTLFLFFEIMSLASFVLVIHEGSEKAMKAGNLYLIMTIAGGLALFFGMIAVFELTGSLAFLDQGILNDPSNLSLGAFVAFLIGFGMKAGMFPVHVWLPEAHPVAPSPSSALLSGIMLKIGAFGLLRITHNLYSMEFLRAMGWNHILLTAAGITIVIGSLLAILQMDLKRRLAYSSIGQMGYILLGMALLTEQALVGDIFHIFAHAVMKSCLFLAAGAIIMKTGRRDIRDLHGVGQEMPVTMVCFTMCSLAMIGIPPFNGFVSKWLLGLGALESGHAFYALLLLISSLLNSVYYMPIVINAFFRKPAVTVPRTREASYQMLIPMVILALGTVLFEIIPFNLPLNLSTITANFLFGGGPGA